MQVDAQSQSHWSCWIPAGTERELCLAQTWSTGCRSWDMWEMTLSGRRTGKRWKTNLFSSCCSMFQDPAQPDCGLHCSDFRWMASWFFGWLLRVNYRWGSSQTPESLADHTRRIVRWVSRALPWNQLAQLRNQLSITLSPSLRMISQECLWNLTRSQCLFRFCIPQLLRSIRGLASDWRDTKLQNSCSTCFRGFGDLAFFQSLIMAIERLQASKWATLLQSGTLRILPDHHLVQIFQE